MTKHVADRRKASTGSRLKAFLRIEREGRETWHRPRPAAGGSRLKQFLRIARGRTV